MHHFKLFSRHQKISCRIIALLLGVLSFSSPAWAQADKSHLIKWRGQVWDTNRPAPEMPESLKLTAYPGSVAKGYYFVQFKGKVTKTMKQAAAAAGAELQSYVPNNTYLVRMSAAAKAQLERSADVQYVGIYQPANRIEPKLLQRILANQAPEPLSSRQLKPPAAAAPEPAAEKKLRLTVLVFKGENLDAVKQAVTAAGGTVLSASEGKRRAKLRVEIPQGQALQLPVINGVMWIEEYTVFEPMNDAAREILDTAAAWAPVNNYRGAGQTVAIADTGLDNGVNNAAMHNDFQGRIASIFSWPVQAIYGALNPGADDGASDLDSGHGTHVAGSAVGNGSLSANTYSGAAPDAGIVYQAIQQYSDYPGTDDDGYAHTGIPDNLNDLFQQAYDAGARIHTNSWGSAVQGQYTANSEEVDEFVWDNPDMLILFSAGNSGVDNNPRNNVVDSGSLGSPGTAKNCLTVGASENNRPAIPNTWSSRYGNTINQDRCANNAAGMAAFSSRGPANANTPAAADDRIKPDLVAPGTYVISTRSRSSANTAWFTDDVEAGVNGWTTTGNWARINAASHSANHSWHDSPAGNYGNNTDAALTSPVQNLSGGLADKSVRFWCRYDLGTGDRWRLDLSKDGGATWPIGIEVTGDQPDWELMSVGMAGFTSYAQSNNFRVRFRLVSDNDGDNGDGLFIDDVQVVEGAFGHGLLSDYNVVAAGSTLNADYFFMGGTSMSTPLTAGCAAAVRQYYTDEIGLAYMSAALLRATLITGAVDLTPGQYGAGANLEIAARPNNVEGWGRVNLNQTLLPAAPAQLDFKDELAGVDDGVTHHYALNVTDNTVPAVVTLVYHDAPGAAIQNNVDLSITPPGGGAALFPNGLAAADGQNNVEQIVIANPQLGAYTINVEGEDIQDGPQPYAVVTRAGGTLADRDPVDVMLALDISGSMLSPAAPGGDSKLNVLKQASELFIRLWTAVAAPGDRLGVVYFRTQVNEFQSGGQVLLDVLPNAPAIINDLNSQTTVPANLTAMGGGLQTCINRLLPEAHPKNIILFTDGMQNVNPMVQALAGGNYKIDNEAGRANSNVTPTAPPTQLDNALGIKINTIGVGATDPYMDLMDGIAASTNGLSKLTQAPDNDLRRFFVEDLIDALREHSPQLIGYRHGQLAGASGSETFTIGKNAQKLVLKLSGQTAGNLDFQVYKGEQNLTRLGKMISGAYYKIYSLELPAKVKMGRITAEGDWTMRITGAANAKYEAAAIADEPLLKYDFSLDQKDYAVGEPLKLGVRLSFGNRPVTKAAVKARVLRPQTGIGTLLSTTASPSGSQATEPGATPDQIKFQALAQQQAFYNSLQPGQQDIIFTNQGDGSYTADFTNTNRPGTYTIIFEASGQGTDMGNFYRTETRSTLVRFGQAELEPSQPMVTKLEEAADKIIYLITLRPKDKHGNFLGPGYQDRIDFTLAEGELQGKVEDLLDGRYTQKISVPKDKDPNITVVVVGRPFYAGPLSQWESVKSWAASLHAGAALPLGTFNQDYDPGFALTLDFGYRLGRQWWLMAYLGYEAFNAGSALVDDTHWMNASANIKYGLLDQALSPYVKGGLGYYHSKHGDDRAGANLGLGLDVDLSSSFTLELGGDYHTLFGQDIQFGQVQAGVIYKF